MNKHGRKLKIGLDYHGVINGDLPYFKKFCTALLALGHEVHILTGGPENVVVRQLKNAGVPYSRLFTIVDFFRTQGKTVCTQDGHFRLDEKLWNTAKADYCRRFRIDIQIDDSSVYGKYFTTPYCHYHQTEKVCCLKGGRTITLDRPAEEAAKELERLLLNQPELQEQPYIRHIDGNPN